MRKIIALLTIGAFGLSVASCANMPSPSDLTAKVAAFEAQVQADAQLVCGFIPTVATIAAMIPGASVVAPEAASVATAICAAIASAPQPKVASAKLKSLNAGVAVNVAKVFVPNVGLVSISGQFTR